MSAEVAQVPTQVGGPAKDASAEGNSQVFPPPSDAATNTDDAEQQPPAEDFEQGSSGMKQEGNNADDNEGVEVVLGSRGSEDKVVDHCSSQPDQNVFRAPGPVRPRAVRGAPPPHVKSSGSYGYGMPSSHPEYGRPYPVPYSHSASFDDGSYHHGGPPPAHYSPHVQYPPPSSRHPPEDVNVISPNHKDGHHRGGPPRRYGGPSSHYQYPPTSPVSRPDGAPSQSSPSRMRNYNMRRPDGSYSSSRGGHSSWGRGHSSPHRSRPPLVAESFDSEAYSSRGGSSHPTTPNAPHYGPPMHIDPNYSFQHGAPSFGGSFDSHAPPPPHFDDHRYYGHPPHHPPESPYSPYSHHGYPPTPGGYYDAYSPHPDYHHPRSYDDGRYGMHHAVTPNDSRSKKDATSGMILPAAASEIDFDVTDPPTEPVTPPSKVPVCESPGDVNSYDVLCGRGGGTNSQIGNRRFRKLVQDFQPIYLLARRKDKPLLARTIVLIIRKRGGRFLKKDDETGELYEVGDAKAEAKTSQALREGLDVRATKSAASSLMDKKKKKKGKKSSDTKEAEPTDTPVSTASATEETPVKSEEKDSLSSKAVVELSPPQSSPEAPPELPRLNGNKPRSPSPSEQQYRKRRRMRSEDAADDSDLGQKSGCGLGPFQDKLFSDFCPPRADIARASPAVHDMNTMELSNTPPRGGMRYHDDDDIRYDTEAPTQDRGCAGIALDMVTGAAACSFSLGPRRWH